MASGEEWDMAHADVVEAQVGPGMEASTVCEAFQRTARACADRVALRTRGGEVEITWAEYADRTRSLAAGIARLGVGRGDTVALMLTNRPEFHLVDNAANHLGAIPFSVYNTASSEQIDYVLADSGARLVVTESALLPSIEPVARQRGIEHVVVVDDAASRFLSLGDVEAAAHGSFDFEAAWRAASPTDLLTMIYTSGTTGPPKPVPVTHESFFYFARSVPWLGLANASLVSYLPMAHIAERHITHATPRLTGATVTCCPDLAAIFDYIREVQPTGYLGMPRIWEKLKASIEAELGAEPDPTTRQQVQRAFSVCTRRVEAEQDGERIGTALREAASEADRVVMRPIRERLGFGRVQWLAVGSAPVPREVLVFFHALGMPITEGWGLTETGGIATMNPQGRIKIGSVGLPVDGIELRVADDGEILARGPLVFDGYRGLPDRTAEVFDSEGWFHTGDVGRIDEDGYVWIVDRKKELIISAGGKNMSPANIEARIKTSSAVIGHAVVVGDRRPYNVALIVLDADGVAAFAAECQIEITRSADVAAHPDVLEEVGEGIRRANEHLARPEQIKRWTVLADDWVPGGDELTPTLKPKRKAIATKYARQIEELYT